MTRPGILRGKSVDSVFKAEKRAESPIFRLDEEGEEEETSRGKEAAEQGEEEERGRTGRPSHKKKSSGMQLTLKDLVRILALVRERGCADLSALVAADPGLQIPQPHFSSLSLSSQRLSSPRLLLSARPRD